MRSYKNIEKTARIRQICVLQRWLDDENIYPDIQISKLTHFLRQNNDFFVFSVARFRSGLRFFSIS